jgi:transcriptional regulator with XRE-family HTH domain
VTAKHFLCEWRKRRKLTQGALAEAVGTSKGVISRYESGDREPDIEMMGKLWQALDVTPSQFFAPPGEPSVDGVLQGLPPASKQALVKLIKSILEFRKAVRGEMTFGER